MEETRQKRRISTLLKWFLVAVLLALAGFLFPWPHRPPKVELLPFTDSPPAWDGSYPHFVISLVADATPARFSSAITLLKPTVKHESPVNQFEVDLHTGRFILRQTDLFVGDVIPLALTRTYVVWDYHSRAFGVGGNHPYDIAPTGTRFPYTYQDLNLEDDYQVHMPRISKGTSYENAVFRHEDTNSEFYGAQDAWNGNGWTFTFRDGGKMYFPEAYMAKSLAQGAATRMEDAHGNHIELRRDQVRNLEELISPSGKRMKFQFDGSDRIIAASDDAGNTRHYAYDRYGHLVLVSDDKGILYRLEYAPLMREAGYDPWMLTAVLDGHWNVLLRTQYLWGRVSEQRLSDGEVFRFEYQLSGREVLQTTVTMPFGEKKVFAFRGGRMVMRGP